MLTNEQFLNVVKNSFKTYLAVGTSRSTAKLKTLHGKIAEDLQQAFGPKYTIKSQGYGEDKEGCLDGRYYTKNVDISVNLGETPVAGYAIKFVMRNYSQNSNNYFENMLGETANLRSSSIPYFQIFIIFDKIPYYAVGGAFQKWDIITQHNLDKYIKMAKDNPDSYYHVPDKTLIALLRLDEKTNISFTNDADYAAHYLKRINEKDLITYSSKIDDVFGNSVILNNYEDFIERTVHIAKGKMKTKQPPKTKKRFFILKHK